MRVHAAIGRAARISNSRWKFYRRKTFNVFHFKVIYDSSFQQIVDLSGNEIGKLSKKWSGLAREYFTDSDNFGITFPMDLDVRMKATLIGACMLIVSKFMTFYDHFRNF